MAMEESVRSTGSGSEDWAAQLEGDIVVPGKPSDDNVTTNEDFNTLDEHVLTTIKRDLHAVGQKLLYALMPTSPKNLLMKEWDWWAHLMFTTYIGITLQGQDGNGSEFSQVFALVWIGTVLITYNFVFTAAANVTNISMFQCVSVLGYCLGPFALAVTLYKIFGLFAITSSIFFIHMLLAVGATAWASVASTKILCSKVQGEQRVMLMVPVLIFYTCVGLLVLYHTYY